MTSTIQVQPKEEEDEKHGFKNTRQHDKDSISRNTNTNHMTQVGPDLPIRGI